MRTFCCLISLCIAVLLADTAKGDIVYGITPYEISTGYSIDGGFITVVDDAVDDGRLRLDEIKEYEIDISLPENEEMTFNEANGFGVSIVGNITITPNTLEIQVPGLDPHHKLFQVNSVVGDLRLVQWHSRYDNASSVQNTRRIYLSNATGSYSSIELPRTGIPSVIEIATVMPILTGDFNGDGTVDAADYTVWRDNYGAMGSDPYDSGDGDGDGDTDGADYLVWQRQVGTMLANVGDSPITTAVPEPSTAVLVLLGLGVAYRRRC